MFEKEFNLRYFEMNKWGEASPITMATLLEETASDHCSEIEHGLFDLYAKDLGWLLISSYMHMNRYPVYKEKIIIRTWLSAYTTTRGYRENIIYDCNYNVIGQARGLWVFFDTKKKRPVKIFDDIIQRWMPKNEVCVDYNIDDKLLHFEEVTCTKKFDIYQYDLDANNHVNNLRYLQWAMETVPEQYNNEKQLSTLEARFLKSAYYGQSAEAVTLSKTNTDCFHHRIHNAATGDVYLTANTAWRQRSPASSPKIYQFA